MDNAWFWQPALIIDLLLIAVAVIMGIVIQWISAPIVFGSTWLGWDSVRRRSQILSGGVGGGIAYFVARGYFGDWNIFQHLVLSGVGGYLGITTFQYLQFLTDKNEMIKRLRNAASLVKGGEQENKSGGEGDKP